MMKDFTKEHEKLHLKTAKDIVGDVIIALLFVLAALIALGGILKFFM